MGIKYNDFAIKGIDVSTYNGVINWQDMPANFSGIRVGYGRTLDNKFNANWSGCKVNKFGYWYLDYYNNHISSHPVYGMSNEAWGREQAETCYKFMGGNEYIFLDIESTTGGYAPKITEVRGRVLEIARAFLTRYDQLNGKKNGIYCSLGLVNWFDNWFKDRPLWVAWYPYRTSMVGTMSIVQMVIDKGWFVKPLIWQYASDGDYDDNGSPDGITYFKTQLKEMDLNGWVGTIAQYDSMFGTNTPDDEVIVIPPTNTRVIQIKEATRTLTLRKKPEVSWLTKIRTYPAGTKFDCLEKVTVGDNTWQRVGIDQYIADNYDGIQYLK